MTKGEGKNKFVCGAPHKTIMRALLSPYVLAPTKQMETKHKQ